VKGYEVIVVGGRVAGASTGLLLARAGVRVALIERSRYGTDTLSTHGLMRAGVLQLSRWGLLDQVIAADTPAIGNTLFHYVDGRSVRVSIRPSPGVDALYAPRRYLLDRILVDAAAEAGVDVLHETTVTALLRDGDGRVSGVRAVGRRGHAIELAASITVGADGIRSTVAHQARAPVVRLGRSCSAMLYRYVSGLSADGYEWAYGAGAAAGLIPTNDGETCVFVSTAPEHMRTIRRSGIEHAFSTLLTRAAPALLDPVLAGAPSGRIHGWAGTPGYVRQSWGPGWVLVGDAGYFKDPITTHGMTDALRDAELLAGELVESMTGGLPEAVAFARYQATRERLSIEHFAATEDVAAYDWDTDGVQALLRRVSSAMSDEMEYLQALPGTVVSNRHAPTERPRPGDDLDGLPEAAPG
jgi:2-polyprenyl-6-methoxyphenol hydroxylase-like FAD-dependent oxidoreductase